MKGPRTKSPILLKALLLLTLSSGMSLPARAADMWDLATDLVNDGFDLLWPDDVTREDIRYRMGAGFGFINDYMGSDNYKRAVIPLVEVNVKNQLLLQGTKVRWNVYHHELFKVGPLINYRFGRKEKANDALTGMGDIENALEVGAFFEGNWQGFLYVGDIRQSLKSQQGVVGQLQLGHGLYQSERVLVVTGVRSFWGNRRHNMSNFGISAEQALTTDYDIYRPTAGFRNAELALYARYDVGSNLRFEMVSLVGKVLGDRADSPLVRDEGSATQLLMGFGARVTF